MSLPIIATGLLSPPSSNADDKRYYHTHATVPAHYYRSDDLMMMQDRRQSTASSVLDEGYSSGASLSFDGCSPMNGALGTPLNAVYGDYDIGLDMDHLSLSTPPLTSAMDDLGFGMMEPGSFNPMFPDQSGQQGQQWQPANQQYHTAQSVQNYHGMQHHGVSGVDAFQLPSAPVLRSHGAVNGHYGQSFQPAMPHLDNNNLSPSPALCSSPAPSYRYNRSPLGMDSPGTPPALPHPSPPTMNPSNLPHSQRARAKTVGHPSRLREPHQLIRRLSVPFMHHQAMSATSPSFSPNMQQPENLQYSAPSQHLMPTLSYPHSPSGMSDMPSLNSPTPPQAPKQYVFINEDPSAEPVEIPAYIDPTSGDAKIGETVINLQDLDNLDDSYLQQTLGVGAKFRCVCGKTFEKLNSLKSHARLHRLERNHVCDVCQRAFVRRQDLKRHQTTHQSDFKPYECNNCGTTFTRSDALHRHTKSKRCM